MTALPNRDRLAERREATRREILDAAWEIAHRDGLAALTLRAVAERIGMRSPSLYTHFESKNAIYDAMFGQAWQRAAGAVARATPLPKAPRRRLLALAEQFFDFAVADLARYQLMNQRTIPDFRAQRRGVCVVARGDGGCCGCGSPRSASRAQADVDLNTAIVAGFVDQQLANDPGGDRWRRQLPRLVDMYADEVGVCQAHASGGPDDDDRCRLGDATARGTAAVRSRCGSLPRSTSASSTCCVRWRRTTGPRRPSARAGTFAPWPRTRSAWSRWRRPCESNPGRPRPPARVAACSSTR